jgi:hypothetical protein
MNKFSKAMDQEAKWIKTENGADAVNTTGNPLLDLYGVIGSLRTRSEDEIINLFDRAFHFDALNTMRLLFYARDVRGGLGERRTPRIVFEYLANNYPDAIANNVVHIPFFGRYDDLFSFVGTPVENLVFETIGNQLNFDLGAIKNNGNPSLLAKWMPSINTSSKKTVQLAKLVANKLSMSEKTYRKMLSNMRSYLNVVESKMSANDWLNIKYAGVPSRAMMIYRKAFSRHDLDGFGKYIESVQKGEEKINSGTLFPYDIFEKMGFSDAYGSKFSFRNWDAILEEQWKALPNYIRDGDNVIVIADTSGSMSGRPVCTSVGLAVYFAERNTGQFHNKFMTFSEIPSWVTISGNTLKQKVANVPAIVANTDLEAAFDLILKVAVENKIDAEEMPKALLVISDMEIDGGTTSGSRMTFHSAMQKKFANAGYQLPNIIYWNVDARQNVFHAEQGVVGVQLASGQSPAVFKAILENIGTTPEEAMMRVLSAERYSCITV